MRGVCIRLSRVASASEHEQHTDEATNDQSGPAGMFVRPFGAPGAEGSGQRVPGGAGRMDGRHVVPGGWRSCWGCSGLGRLVCSWATPMPRAESGVGQPCRPCAWPHTDHPDGARHGAGHAGYHVAARRRFSACAITMDRPRFVTASVLRPSPAAVRPEWAGPWLHLRTVLRVSAPATGREAERFGMGPAAVLGQDLAEVPGPVRDG